MDGMGKTSGVTERFDKKELEAWLRTQPVEVSVVLAVRSALRALPHIQSALLLRKGGLDTILLPLIRASSMSWLAATQEYFLDRGKIESISKSANYAGIDVAVSSEGGGYYLVSARYASGSVAFAASSINNIYNEDSRKLAEYASNSIFGFMEIYEISPGPDGVRSAVSRNSRAAVKLDIQKLEAGTSPQKLTLTSLWHGGVPQRERSEWRQFRRFLLSHNEDWDIWTDWYEDRLAGKPAIPVLDVARVTLPDGLWKQGAKAVNAELKRIRADLQAEGAEDPKAETGNLQGSGLSESGQEGTGQEPNWHEVVKQRLQDEAPVSAVIEDGRIAARDSPPDAKPPIDHPEDLQARLLGLRVAADKVLATLGEMPHNLGPYLARDIGHFSKAASQSPPAWYALDDAAACLRDHLRLLEDLAWPGATREDVERLVRRTEELRLLLQPQQPEPAPAANEKPPLELDPDKATPCAVGEILSGVEEAIRADGGRVLAPSAQQTLEHYTEKAREVLASPDTSEASEPVRQRRLTRWLKGLGGFAASTSGAIGVAVLTAPEAASTLMIRFETILNAIARLFT
ncbi:hypothetical protein [Stappia indica]|uniref:hypothetical protein n=1 Tax=Stappia indica TaxID=538381 RepID=UPI001CD354F0|nr:hypothetical protein [Stappia indica]MCA1298912.1 hypothetical protein [Stappia indica]